MKANELSSKDLMVGDWADFASELGDPPIAKIINVNNLYMIDNGRMVVRPIPLTPEILEKNGFELIKGTYPTLRNHYRDIIFQMVKIGETKYNKPFYTFKGCPIYYVHQLQHAMKLCEIDKEIII